MPIINMQVDFACGNESLSLIDLDVLVHLEHLNGP